MGWFMRSRGNISYRPFFSKSCSVRTVICLTSKFFHLIRTFPLLLRIDDECFTNDPQYSPSSGLQRIWASRRSTLAANSCLSSFWAQCLRRNCLGLPSRSSCNGTGFWEAFPMNCPDAAKITRWLCKRPRCLSHVSGPRSKIASLVEAFSSLKDLFFS